MERDNHTEWIKVNLDEAVEIIQNAAETLVENVTDGVVRVITRPNLFNEEQNNELS